MRSHRAHVDFDALLRDLMHIGVGMLVAWSLTGVVGVVSEQLVLDSQATLRFLLAILVVVFARRTYWEIREWRWRKVSPDDRYGFSSPL